MCPLPEATFFIGYFPTKEASAPLSDQELIEGFPESHLGNCENTDSDVEIRIQIQIYFTIHSCVLGNQWPKRPNLGLTSICTEQQKTGQQGGPGASTSARILLCLPVWFVIFCKDSSFHLLSTYYVPGE